MKGNSGRCHLIPAPRESNFPSPGWVRELEPRGRGCRQAGAEGQGGAEELSIGSVIRRGAGAGAHVPCV